MWTAGFWNVLRLGCLTVLWPAAEAATTTVAAWRRVD